MALEELIKEYNEAKNLKGQFEEFLTIFKGTIDVFNKMKAESASERSTYSQHAQDTIASLEERFEALSNDIVAKLSAIKDGLPGRDGIDGLSPDMNELAKMAAELIKLPEYRAPIMDGPQEIATKLDLLADEEQLLAIRDLRAKHEQQQKEIDELKRRPSGGGGGMSQLALQFAMSKLIKHQVFSTSSATTTSTLTNRVAGNVVIWLRYNGQMLNYGSQYTVSGKTITYTFTLDDSSEVEVTYLAS